ncbi:hypothetical protein HK405_012934, partial [Cladochytrium tenue]
MPPASTTTTQMPTLAGGAASAGAAATASAPPPPCAPPPMVDAARFLSAEARARRPTSLKALYKYAARPGMRVLAGGLPHPSTFAVRGLRGGTRLPDFDRGSGSQLPPGLPRELVLAEADTARLLQYGGGAGQPELVDAVRASVMGAGVPGRRPAYAERAPETWEVVVSCGNTAALEQCFRCFLDSGDGLLV